MDQEFLIGDRVYKDGGDYFFAGEIVSAFQKLKSKQWRYVVENPDGILHIFSGKQLKLAMDKSGS